MEINPAENSSIVHLNRVCPQFMEECELEGANGWLGENVIQDDQVR